MKPSRVAAIIGHLGGEDALANLGARDFVFDETHVSFTLVRPNSKGVHSVLIAAEDGGRYKVSCHGRLESGSLTPPLIGSANAIALENLAAVVRELAGIDIPNE